MKCEEIKILTDSFNELTQSNTKLLSELVNTQYIRTHSLFLLPLLLFLLPLLFFLLPLLFLLLLLLSSSPPLLLFLLG